MSSPPYPLDASIATRINSEYAAYYNAHLSTQAPSHLQPIAATRALGGALVPGGGPLRPVGSTVDRSVPRTASSGPHLPVRCFSPAGEPPPGGWPALLFLHGGGWVFGNLETENGAATHFCARAQCVVVAVDYRLAPENPFPAAVQDAWEVALWLATTGPSLLFINPERLCIGGSSAGGNLAAVISQRAVSSSSVRLSFRLQLLIVPVTDNTADPSNNVSYAANEHAPVLSVAQMMWYRNHYLPDRGDWANPEASPLLWTGDWAALPPAVVVVAGLDPLRHEGERFAARLRDAGVDVRLRVFEGQPHAFAAMDGVLEDGRRAITWLCEALRDAMYGSKG
ncbi:hypothetical protein XA68_13671 [Ophiocordyceps unilateralis]|uniref:Alpha/beta hydrolase fold-3 domain-containing protein n=1 Tax=Ophiocordyceps unilateralis TaxID=268505 RepID=A0A2A9PC32_OPHUN|nr:hypothetical protein XA68_13671 [Ophiocordyceps unilateralis]